MKSLPEHVSLQDKQQFFAEWTKEQPWVIDTEEKKAMGEAGRRKMERQFDRRIVVNAYIDEINEILTTKS